MPEKKRFEAWKKGYVHWKCKRRQLSVIISAIKAYVGE